MLGTVHANTFLLEQAHPLLHKGRGVVIIWAIIPISVYFVAARRWLRLCCCRCAAARKAKIAQMGIEVGSGGLAIGLRLSLLFLLLLLTSPPPLLPIIIVIILYVLEAVASTSFSTSSFVVVLAPAVDAAAVRVVCDLPCALRGAWTLLFPGSPSEEAELLSHVLLLLPLLLLLLLLRTMTSRGSVDEERCDSAGGRRSCISTTSAGLSAASTRRAYSRSRRLM